MSVSDRASQRRIAWLCGWAKLCRIVPRPRIRPQMTAEGLDDRMKRDIGIATGPFDPGARPDPRGDHYRRLMRCGWPLG
ncbi:MAG: hypothetical protein RIC18_06045 [Hoeflea sp.]|uniref:hypothetical protein n=1 Tax=Hoeflea sp. TaxID=1940281 RepID=UPI0032EE41FC